MFFVGVLRINKMADVDTEHIYYHEILFSKEMISKGEESFTSKVG